MHKQTTQGKNILRKRVVELEQEAVEKTWLILTIQLFCLTAFRFAIKKISLIKDEIRERFEREYFQFLENRGLITILVKGI